MRAKGAGRPPRRPGDDFLMIFGGFWAPFWEPWGLIFGLFGDFFSVFFGYGSGGTFWWILGPFWKTFWSHFGDFFRTPRFRDFYGPCNAKPSFLRVGGGPFRHFFGVFFGPRFRTSFFVVFGRFLDPLGLHFGVPGPSFPALCCSRFF